MSEVAILALVFIGTLIAAIVIPQMLLRKAVPQVIKILRQHGAIDAEHAVRPEAVGLAQQSVWDRALKRRDYKPKALSGLLQIGVVDLNDEGKVFLSEAALARSPFKDV